MSDRLASATTLPDRAVPTRVGALVFEAKAALLRLHRAARDRAGDGPKRQHPAAALADAPVLATIRSPLWTTTGGAKDRALNAGKIQNLRAAIAGLDEIEVRANEVLSFWRQVGRPLRRRGFVEGRELREGCMIATVGGGLCQLSNALHEAAVEAGLEIVERHAHTRVVPGSRAAAGRDATVFWNYLDLRIRGVRPFRVEARLTADALELTIRGDGARVAPAAVPLPATDRIAHDCLSCGQVTCHRHDPDIGDANAATAWLVDAATPEFVALYRERHRPNDVTMLPSRRIGSGAGWPATDRERTADIVTLRRSLALRAMAGRRPRAATLLAADASLAAHYARGLAPDLTHLVVAQSLLPHLWRLGALGGRRFDVLLDRMPIDLMHQLLDVAYRRHPDSSTLADFRAPAAIVAAERAALGAARRLFTPHRAVAAAFPAGRVGLLDWQPAAPLAATRGGRTFLFAGPTLARKGIHAMRDAMDMMDTEIALLIERPGEDTTDFWKRRNVRPLASGERPAVLAGVVLPAIVEHRPATLLRALAAGLPVIATAACGMQPQPGLTLIAPDNAVALRDAMQGMLVA